MVHAHIDAGHAPACSLLNIDLRLLSCSGCKAKADNDRGRQQEAAQQDRPQRSWQCQSQVSPQEEGRGRVGVECFTRILKTCLFADCHGCLNSYMHSKRVCTGFKCVCLPCLSATVCRLRWACNVQCVVSPPVYAAECMASRFQRKQLFRVNGVSGVCSKSW